MKQASIFEDARMKLQESIDLAVGRSLSVTPRIEELLRQNAPIAIGVSGGKDSCAVAFVVNEYLDEICHYGPRLLIHSDLGRTEWRDSLPTCRRLSESLRMELVIVRRQSGDMLARWQQRWRNNLARYVNLECVKLILPWSTPSMRFCTSELKTDIICRHLVSRFQGQTIVSVSGIRREESPARAKAEIAKPQTKLFRAATKSAAETNGIDWHPIIEWKETDVFSYLEERGFPLHEAYKVFGSSRVSCCFCIMSSQDDLRAASSCSDNQDLYRLMVALEAESTFSFQGGNWLGDVAPELLPGSLLYALVESKRRARLREEAESRIPKHLLYVKGWPTGVPTEPEAELLSEVRRSVSDAINVEVKFTDPQAVILRYEQLIEAKRCSMK